TMGPHYAQDLTTALATHFTNPRPPQVVAALFAAAGEEMFFRGFIQGRCGIVAGAVAFMIAHLGGRDIRVIGYWSIFQGLGLGACYAWSGNLLVPMLAHGLFDAGAMIHFRRFMAQRFAEAL